LNFHIEPFRNVFFAAATRGPHRQSIALAVPRGASIDFLQFKRERPPQGATNGESPYRAGDKLLTHARDFRFRSSITSSRQGLVVPYWLHRKAFWLPPCHLNRDVAVRGTVGWLRLNIRQLFAWIIHPISHALPALKIFAKTWFLNGSRVRVRTVPPDSDAKKFACFSNPSS